jgi:hypothetical protein
MQEITVSPNHIEDSAGAFDSAVDAAFSPNEQAELYVPPQEELPRASYALFATTVLARNANLAHNGGIKLDRANTDLLGSFNNLRVVIGVPTRDNRAVHFPGVVLTGTNGEPAVGFLRSDPITDGSTSANLSTMQQTLLDQLYTMHNSDPSHSAAGNRTQVNVAEIAHASLIASSASPRGIHQNVHNLADDGKFAQNFTAQGSLDIRSGHDTRKVTDAVVPANRLAELYVYPQHQLEQPNAHGLELTAGQLAVGLVLASAQSRQINVPIEQNLTAVAERSH